MKINQNEIRKILNESVITPNKPGTWKIIAETANVDYFRLRAIECLREAEIMNPDENIKKAISLLALARYFHRTQGVTEKLDKITRFDKEIQ